MSPKGFFYFAGWVPLTYRPARRLAGIALYGTAVTSLKFLPFISHQCSQWALAELFVRFLVIDNEGLPPLEITLHFEFSVSISFFS